MRQMTTVSLRWVKKMTDYPFKYGYVRSLFQHHLEQLESGSIPTKLELQSIRDTLQRVDIGGAMGYDGLQGAKTNNVTTDPTGEPKNSNL